MPKCWEKEKKGLSFWIPAETCPRRLLSGTCRKDGKGGGKDGRGSLSPVMPARSPSVMPDGFYRASSVFSLPHHPVRPGMPAPPWISSEDGFPLKTCGNDRKGGRREGREGELAGIHPTDEEFLGFEAPGTWIRFGVQGNWNVSPPGRTLPLGLLRRPIHFHPPATIEARNAIPGFSTGIRERGKHDGSPIIRTDGLKVQKMFIHHRL